jgi:uroporphyrinogen-III synthase
MAAAARSSTVLVVREFDNFSRILSESGFTVVNCPTIETVPLEDLSDLAVKLEAHRSYDGFFLTSRAAAAVLRRKLREGEISYRGKIYVLGKRSFEILRPEKLDLVYFEKAKTAREMLALIPPEDLKGKRFLFVRGALSLRVVPEYLAKISRVDETIVYETRKIAAGIDKIKAVREMFERGEIAAACFFSPSAAESFFEQFGAKVLHQKRIAAIGPTTAGFFERRKLTVDFVSSKATAEDFARELIEYLKEN